MFFCLDCLIFVRWKRCSSDVLCFILLIIIFSVLYCFTCHGRSMLSWLVDCCLTLLFDTSTHSSGTYSVYNQGVTACVETTIKQVLIRLESADPSFLLVPSVSCKYNALASLSLVTQQTSFICALCHLTLHIERDTGVYSVDCRSFMCCLFLFCFCLRVANMLAFG